MSARCLTVHYGAPIWGQAVHGRRNLHKWARLLRCIHLHPTGSGGDSVWDWVGGWAEDRGGGSCRACTFSPLQDFAFHSLVGLKPPLPQEWGAHIERQSKGWRSRMSWCTEEVGMPMDGVVSHFESEGKVAPHWARLSWSQGQRNIEKIPPLTPTPSSYRETAVRTERAKEPRTSIRIHVQPWICVCVPVCYVILSRPQLLSHTQQACWGEQPTCAPAAHLPVFLHPWFSPFAHPPPPFFFPLIFFLLIDLTQYGSFSWSTSIHHFFGPLSQVMKLWNRSRMFPATFRRLRSDVILCKLKLNQSFSRHSSARQRKDKPGT